MKQFYFKIFNATHVWVIAWNKHVTSNPVMVGVVSLTPTGGNFIFR